MSMHIAAMLCAASVLLPKTLWCADDATRLDAHALQKSYHSSDEVIQKGDLAWALFSASWLRGDWASAYIWLERVRPERYQYASPTKYSAALQFRAVMNTRFVSQPLRKVDMTQEIDK